MNFQHKNSLPIGTIANEWAKKRSGEDTLDVVGDLLQAFWLGHLVGIQLADDHPYLMRCRALVLLFPSREEECHPGIAICRSENEVSSMVTYRDDGSADVDTRAAILLPTDKDRRTPDLNEQAYRTLSECNVEDYSFISISLFRAMTVSKLAFLDYIRCCSLEPPSFWYQPRAPLKGITESAINVHRATVSAHVRPRRGRKIRYDYEAIDAYLDKLRLAEGAAAFEDKTALHTRVLKHFADAEVPKRSQFQKHLKQYRAAQFSA